MEAEIDPILLNWEADASHQVGAPQNQPPEQPQPLARPNANPIDPANFNQAQALVPPQPHHNSPHPYPHHLHLNLQQNHHHASITRSHRRPATRMEISNIENRHDVLEEDQIETERTIVLLQEETQRLRRENAEFRQRLAMIEATLANQTPAGAAQGDPMEVDDEDDDDDEEESEGGSGEGGDDDEDEDEDEEGGGGAALEDGGDEQEDEDGAAAAVVADTLPFKCTRPGCHKAYRSQAALDRHMAETHNSDPATRKAHVCPVCNKSYDTHKAVVAHRRNHKPEGSSERGRVPVPGGCVCPVAGCGEDHVTVDRRRHHVASKHPGWRAANPGWSKWSA